MRLSSAACAQLHRSARFLVVGGSGVVASTMLGVGLALTIFTVLVATLSLDYLAANLVGIGAGTVWYYLANSRFIWAPPTAGTSR